jgi:phosphatidylserine decarboxylase
MIGDAFKFILPFLAVAAALAFFGMPAVALVLVLLSAFVAWFFRNPLRQIPEDEKAVVSPADGKVVKISTLPEDGELPGGHAVSIFLNIFDVHVNRAPISGLLEKLEYKRGRFKAAFDDEASRVNEQNILTIRGPETQVIVKQIAGVIARRVICWKKAGNSLERGELIGLIRFGSRVDILLSRNVRILVRVGDHVRGGSSIVGERA